MTLVVGTIVWEDWLGEQDAPTLFIRPRTVAELVAWLDEPGRMPPRLRAVGSGHSTSPVARPWRALNDPGARAGMVVVTDRLELDHADVAERWWAETPDVRRLARVEAGATIRTLNSRFDERGLAFPNLGSYDGQTIAGALATGTHGTGLVTGPLCDLVASIEILGVEMREGRPRPVLTRVEPANGPTDRSRFEADAHLHGMSLVQEDAAFYACVVSLGLFGLVTAVTLRLTDPFWLKEEQTLIEWTKLRPNLIRCVKKADWLDFVLSARPTHEGPGGFGHKCLVTRRVSESDKGDGPPRSDRRRQQLEEKPASDARARTKSLANLASRHPRFANYCAVGVFEEEARRSNHSRSHRILRTSIGDLVLATSAEVAVPLERVVEVVDTIIEQRRRLDEDHLHHTSPFGVRFSQASSHYLSPAYNRPTCTIEAPLLLFTRSHRGRFEHEPSSVVIDEILERFCRAVKDRIPEARFHPGQRSWTTAANLRADYPMFAPWSAQRRRFDPLGIFENELVTRWDL